MLCGLFTSKYTERRPLKEKENNFQLCPALSFISSKRSSSSHIFSFVLNVTIMPYISSDVSESENLASSFAFSVLVDEWLVKNNS